MNLAKKILALTCLTAGLFTSQKAFSFEKGDEIKYKTLFLCNYGYVPNCMNNAMGVGWDTNSDGKEDLKGLYALLPTEEQNIFELRIIGNKNDSPTNDEIFGYKYAKFLLGIGEGNVVIGWYNFEGGFSVKKLYYYKSLGVDADKNMIYKLQAIQEDTNANRQFENYEFMYKSEDFGRDK